jgi:23S rRNA pseudouridine1911/1915/1917 synthase
MRYTGTPIIGDPLYGGGEKHLLRVDPLFKANARKALSLSSSQALQAVKLAFVHPRTREPLQFETSHQEDFKNLLNFLQGINNAN